MIRHILRALGLGICLAAVLLAGVVVVWGISFAAGSRMPVEPFRTIGTVVFSVYELPIRWIRPPHDSAWKILLEVGIPIVFWGGILEAALSWRGRITGAGAGAARPQRTSSP